MDMEISNARNIKFTWHGMAVGYPTYKLSWKIPPPGDLGTLRPATFKLAFLAGGPPMPSTWE